MSLTESIKSEAWRLGFELVGVAKPDFPPGYPDYDGWLAKGRHGEMDYLATDRARQRRADPHQILPEVQSVLVLGMRHDNPASAPKPKTKRALGRIAAYAWGDDYHEVIPGKLKQIVDFIERKTGHKIPNRWYTDTGAVLERDLGQRAGLGWIGKNTMLISPQSGSYWLLAEVMLGLALEPDAPFKSDHCGSCTRCIEACPTDCILPDRTIDARRCISYLTIELKGAIPHELRPQMGDWVFGCDVCQEVCPWNVRFAPAKGEEAFAPRPDAPWVDLEKELALTQEEFNAKFRRSPVKRPKRRGYLRNVAVALGNSGSRESISALRDALLDDPELLVRGHAAWALGQLGGENARDALVQAKEGESDKQVLEEIDLALNLA
jgi:epoxyqueuosine reductase